jgi:hypothetical protein
MGNCATETAALRGLLDTEYAGRAFYAAAKDTSDMPMCRSGCTIPKSIIGVYEYC